jgi:hypothetical protein
MGTNKIKFDFSDFFYDFIWILQDSAKNAVTI